MTSKIRFFIPGTPIAQARHRGKVYLHQDSDRNLRAKSHLYDPSKKDKLNLFDFVYRFRPKRPWQGPVTATIIFQFPLPAKRPRFMSIDAFKYLSPGSPHIVKPDLDNLEKFVLDALRGPTKDKRSGMKLPSVFFLDDCQVCAVQSMKSYVPIGLEGTKVTLTHDLRR